MTHVYSWKAALEASQKVNWQPADVFRDRRPDLSRPLLPAVFAGTEGLTFLDAGEKRLVNQIRGRGYVHICCTIDEFILPFVLEHARYLFNGDGWRVRALLQFAAEESKHIETFHRYLELFDRDFPVACGGIGPTDRMRRMVLAHDPLAVAMVVLMVEWMILAQFNDHVAGDGQIDPLMQDLLRYHALDEMQHAKIDTLMVETLAASRDRASIARTVDEFFAISALLDAGLAEQVGHDIASFEKLTGRVFEPGERETFRRMQHQTLRWTFLWSGMRHPNFVSTLESLGGDARNRITEAAPAFV